MTTLLSELVRVLSVATARELRERADTTPLSRSEMKAIATLTEISAAYLRSPAPPPIPAGAPDWASFQALADHDAQLIGSARRATGEAG